ncbi:hypothetical protein ACVIIW_007209 [Bradyrhizobium sp. USDA 4449]
MSAVAIVAAVIVARFAWIFPTTYIPRALIPARNIDVAPRGSLQDRLGNNLRFDDVHELVPVVAENAGKAAQSTLMTHSGHTPDPKSRTGPSPAVSPCDILTRKKWRDCTVKRREFIPLLGAAAVAHSVVGER